MFWRNPSAAFFNFVLPLLFLAAGGAILSGNQHDLNRLVPSIAGMSVMSTTFTALAYNIVFLRERGVLKRIRGTPLPTISYFGGVAANAVTNTALQIAIIVLAGRAFFGIGWPRHWVELIVFVLVGVVSLAALGVAFAHVIPNFESTAAYVNAVFLPVVFVSFYVFDSSSAPRLPAHDRRSAAAEAADRRPVRGDGHRLGPRQQPRRARRDRAVGRARAVPRRARLLLGGRARREAARRGRPPAARLAAERDQRVPARRRADRRRHAPGRAAHHARSSPGASSARTRSRTPTPTTRARATRSANGCRSRCGAGRATCRRWRPPAGSPTRRRRLAEPAAAALLDGTAAPGRARARRGRRGRRLHRARDARALARARRLLARVRPRADPRRRAQQHQRQDRHPRPARAAGDVHPRPRPQPRVRAPARRAATAADAASATARRCATRASSPTSSPRLPD